MFITAEVTSKLQLELHSLHAQFNPWPVYHMSLWSKLETANNICLVFLSMWGDSASVTGAPVPARPVQPLASVPHVTMVNTRYGLQHVSCINVGGQCQFYQTPRPSMLISTPSQCTPCLVLVRATKYKKYDIFQVMLYILTRVLCCYPR